LHGGAAEVVRDYHHFSEMADDVVDVAYIRASISAERT